MKQLEQITVAQDTYTYTTTVTLEECQDIALRIAEENTTHGKHMLEKSAEELCIQAKEYWCCIIKNADELIWCVFLMPVEQWWITLYERWSLFVKPQHRGKNISYTLIQNMLKLYSHLPLYSITNVPAVMKNTTKLQQHEYTKTIIPQHILAVLEVPWALLDNDIIYCNELLHALLQPHD